MKTKLLALALLAGSTMFGQTRITFGLGIGGYAPHAFVAVRPPCPGPDYFWEGGYWVRHPHYVYPAVRAGYYGHEYRDREFRREHAYGYGFRNR